MSFWRIRAWWHRTKEKTLMAIWQRLPRSTRDIFALWRMGQLQCTDTLANEEVGGITTDQYIRAMKEDELTKSNVSESGQAWIWVVCVMAFFALIFGGWAFQYFTADIRGKIGANEQIKANPNFRIEAYERFYNQCASVQSVEQTYQATKSELATVKDERRRGQINTNLVALQAARADAVNQYNADSNKSYTAGQFKSSDLPFQLPTTMPMEGTTACTA